jgi:phosphopantetheine--protein transferase-like protein
MMLASVRDDESCAKELEDRVLIWYARASDLLLNEVDTSILSKEELAKADTFVYSPDRTTWVASRILLRGLLSKQLSTNAKDIEIEAGPNGKPQLAGQYRDRAQFSLSHTQWLAAVAVSKNVPVGIDLEYIDPALEIDLIAPSVLTEAELQTFESLTHRNRLRYFYELWVRKEAVLKCLGIGFTVEPRHVEVGHPVWHATELRIHKVVTNIELLDLQLPAGYVGTLAVLPTTPFKIDLPKQIDLAIMSIVS